MPASKTCVAGWTHVYQKCHTPPVSTLGIISQFAHEVVLKDLRNLNKQLCVNAILAENAIYAAALTVEFTCQPTHRTFLTDEFFPDSFSDVDHSRPGSLNPRGNDTRHK